MTAHLPTRPTWACLGCGGAWPCPTRREQLLAEYTGAPVSLGMYLAACLVDAVMDIPDAPAGSLYRRFLGWARPVPQETVMSLPT